jgi:hypothetical protein
MAFLSSGHSLTGLHCKSLTQTLKVFVQRNQRNRCMRERVDECGGGTVRVFRQKFTLEDAFGSHVCSLEARTCV